MSTSAEVLIQDIVEDFSSFLKEGDKINFSSIYQKIYPSLEITDIEKLLRIHFILTDSENPDNPGVIPFVKQLPDRIKRIKTTVIQKTEKYEGEVKGRIKWNETIRSRYNSNSGISPFICDRIERDYDIPENLILKKIISIIHNIIENDLKDAIEGEYGWLDTWIKDEKLKDVVSSLYLKNIYLKRITREQDFISDKMINRAMKSRNPLYRDAAFLLRRYYKLVNYEFNEQEAKSILASTFIKPDKIETLFELYWIVKIIRLFKLHSDVENFSLIPLEKGQNIVACWKLDGNTYRISHNSQANFNFRETVEDNIPSLSNHDSFFGRQIQSIKMLEQCILAENHLDMWRGRPDIILEIRDDDQKLKQILIGEVKYTNRPQTAINGLRELLEYLALIKDGCEYLEQFENLFKNHQYITGCLFTDTISDLKIRDNEIIRVVQIGDDEKLATVVGDFV